MATSDRAFRALARAEPAAMVDLLRVVAPGVVPAGDAVTPDDLAATQIDAVPPTLDADWVARVGDADLVHLEGQGYRDADFLDRLLWYHLGLVLRYRRVRRVRTVALWLQPPPTWPRGGARVEALSVGDVRVDVTVSVLADVAAGALLAVPRAACFAAGADAGAWTAAELCARVVAVLAAHRASWVQRHMAVVAAATRGRYDAMVAAMESAGMEPIIIEDLVKFGEDRGEARGEARGLARGLAPVVRMVERRLRRDLTPAEGVALTARLETLGGERLGDVVLDLGAEALAAWLADPAAR